MLKSLALAVALFLAPAAIVHAERPPQIVKVLPHFLDLNGRHTVSPSLYERDAYQADLRKHPEKVSALRFDIQWKSGPHKSGNLKLRLEMIGAKSRPNEIKILEKPVTPNRWWENWSSLALTKEEFHAIGEPTAWRVTLLDGQTVIAEQKSFLW